MEKKTPMIDSALDALDLERAKKRQADARHDAQINLPPSASQLAQWARERAEEEKARATDEVVANFAAYLAKAEEIGSWHVALVRLLKNLEARLDEQHKQRFVDDVLRILGMVIDARLDQAKWIR